MCYIFALQVIQLKIGILEIIWSNSFIMTIKGLQHLLIIMEFLQQQSLRSSIMKISIYENLKLNKN